MHHDETNGWSYDASNDEQENVRPDSRLRLERRDEPDHDNPEGDSTNYHDR